MMGSENADEFEETNLNAPREEMENLVLGVNGDGAGGDGHLTKIDVNGSAYRSAMPTLSNTLDSLSPLPTVLTPADSDTLLAPSSYIDFRSLGPKPSSNDNSFIEPPSYAYVIFSPFDENSDSEINGAEDSSRDSLSSDSLSRSPSSSSSGYIKISVSNPCKKLFIVSDHKFGICFGSVVSESRKSNHDLTGLDSWFQMTFVLKPG